MLVYAALAGFALPAVRAVIMLAVAQVVMLSRRRTTPSAGLSVSVLVMLAIDPLATLTASFWLSYLAVAVILCIAAQSPATADTTSRAKRLWSALRTFARLQVSIGVALLPIAAFTFQEVSIAGFGINFFAVPFFALVLVPMALVQTVALLSGSAVGLVASAAAPVATLAWAVLEYAAQWQFAAISVPAPSPFMMLLAAAGALLLLLTRRRRRWLGLAALAPMFIVDVGRPEAGDFDMTVLDVGHGLATVIRTAQRTLIYDTGPKSRSGFDAGVEIVLPALRALGVTKVDRIVVSHSDLDHAGGLAALSAEFPGASIHLGPDADDTVKRTATCRAGEQWVWDGVRFRYLHPPEGFLPEGNETSCVLLIETAAGRVLLAGDIERRAEQWLASGRVPEVTALIAPHHGSATSSTAPFVNRTRPKYVLVSAGFQNRWGFPRPEVLERWHSAGATVLTTADVGATTFTVSGGTTRVSARRLGRHRYWEPHSGATQASAL